MYFSPSLWRSFVTSQTFIASVSIVAPLQSSDNTKVSELFFKILIDFFYSAINKIYMPNALAFVCASGGGFPTKARINV